MKISKISFKHSFSDSIIFKESTINLSKEKPNLIIGANGTGKSTLALLMAQLIKSKNIKFFEEQKELNKKELKKFKQNTFMLFQEAKYQLFDLNVSKEITLNLKKNQDLIFEIEYLFEKFKLDIKLLDQKSDSLSSGQQRKILLISALINPNLEIIILDEPTLDLDEESKEYFVNLINSISKEKQIIIFSHDFESFNVLNYNTYLIKDKTTSKILNISDLVDKLDENWLSLEQKIEYFKIYKKESENDKN